VKVKCKAIYPGKEEATTLKSAYRSGALQVQVPLVRGCAMVKIVDCMENEKQIKE
jgi:hypothetical protein